MSKVNWLLDKDVFREDIDSFAAEITRQGMKYKMLDCPPFTSKLDCDQYLDDECVIFYGSLVHANLVRKWSKWIPGVFYNPDAYYCRSYYPAFGELLLNSNYVMLPYGELLRRKDFLFNTLGQDKSIFVRPDFGGKSFTGTLVLEEDYELDVKDIGYGQLEKSALVVVAEPKNIISEWRLLVVNQEIKTGSRYKSNNRLMCDGTKDKDYLRALDFAQAVVELYDPDRAWTLDICETKDGKIHVLEIGCFSCSGLYACDKKIVIREVAKAALEEWKEFNLD